MDQTFFRVVNTQIALSVIFAIGAYVIYQDSLIAKSAFYGGAISFINSFIALRRSKVALDKLKEKSLTEAKYSIYMGAILRFIITLLLFIVGFGYFRFNIPAVLVTFGLTQLVYNWSLKEFKKKQVNSIN